MQKILSPKISYWLKTLSKFASVQIFVQVLGFASGILLIRNLDKQEYAYFVLANSMQGTMNVLADSGISSALLAIGGKVWQDFDKFGQLIKTAMQFKLYLAVIAVVVVTPILMWMLLNNGANWIYASILTISILIELHFYLSDGVLIIVPRLHSQFNHLQNLGLVAGFTRLTLLLGSSIFALNAAVGIFASTIASGLKNRLLKNYVKKVIPSNSSINLENRQEIIKIFKLQAPANIFYCFQGQLTIWLISFFGSTENIAEVGALSRLSVVFTLISSIGINVFIPIFARCQNPNFLWKKYFQVIGFFLIFAFCLLVIILLFPNTFLLILGSQYYDLQSELIWVVLQAIFYQLFVLLFSLNSSRGWIANPSIFISFSILGQILSLLVLDVSTVKGVILFDILSTIPGFIIAFYLSYRGIKNFSMSEL